jgi:hypothetical protein
MREVPRFRKDGEGSVVLYATRANLLNGMAEIIMLCNEAMDGQRERTFNEEVEAERDAKQEVVLAGAAAALPRVRRIGLKPLSVEYVADRLTTDDPIWGYIVRSKEHGWLQGFVNLTTFTTWSRGFSFDSLHEQADIVDDSGLPLHGKPPHKVDCDGSLSTELMREVRGGYADGHGVVWPRIAEISLLGGLGCGGWLLRLIIAELEAKDPRKSPYRWLVLQATDNSVSFYEAHGFVRVGAVATHKENVKSKEEEEEERRVRAAEATIDEEELKWLGVGHESCATIWIEAKPDDTPRTIAKRHGIDAFDIIFLNKVWYTDLKPTSRLMKGTRLRIPTTGAGYVPPKTAASAKAGAAEAEAAGRERAAPSAPLPPSASVSASSRAGTPTVLPTASTSAPRARGAHAAPRVAEHVAEALARRRAFRHVCAENERPIDLARRFKVDYKELVRLNLRWYSELTSTALLREGTELRIPHADPTNVLDCDDGKCAYRHWTFPDDPVEYTETSKMMVRRLNLRPVTAFRSSRGGTPRGGTPRGGTPRGATPTGFGHRAASTVANFALGGAGAGAAGAGVAGAGAAVAGAAAAADGPLAMLPAMLVSNVARPTPTLRLLSEVRAAEAAVAPEALAAAAAAEAAVVRIPRKLRIVASKTKLRCDVLGPRTAHAIDVKDCGTAESVSVLCPSASARLARWRSETPLPLTLTPPPSSPLPPPNRPNCPNRRSAPSSACAFQTALARRRGRRSTPCFVRSCSLRSRSNRNARSRRLCSFSSRSAPPRSPRREGSRRASHRSRSAPARSGRRWRSQRRKATVAAGKMRGGPRRSLRSVRSQWSSQRTARRR